MAVRGSFDDLNPVVPTANLGSGTQCPCTSDGQRASGNHATYEPGPKSSGDGAQSESTPDSDRANTSTRRCRCVTSLLRLVQRFVCILLSRWLARAQQLFLRGQLPDAVISQSVLLRNRFLRKALGLLILQIFGTLGVATGVAFLDALRPAPGYLLGIFCVTTVISFACASLERFSFPRNYMTLASLTIFAGVAIGLLTKKLQKMHDLLCDSAPGIQKIQLVFLTSYAVALLVASLLVMLFSRQRTMRVSVAACVGAFSTDIVLCAIWTQTKFCSLGWLCGMTVVLSTSVLWLGFDMDRLLGKLMVDEYVLPALLVWGDLFIFLALGCFVVLFYILLVGEVEENESWLCCCECWLEDPPEPVPDASPALDASPRPDVNNSLSPAPMQGVPDQARMAWARN